MPFPSYTPPQLGPNPYQIAGQAASQLGAQVQDFGNNQDKIRMAYEDMVEKRKQKILEDQRAKDELLLKQNADERAAAEAKQKADLAASRETFLKDFTGADPADPANQVKLRQALTSGIIDKGTFDALQPPAPDRFSAGGGYYEMGPDGKPITIVAPTPPAPRQSRLKEVTLDDGTLGVLDLDTQRVTPVRGDDGTTIRGGTKDQGGKTFQQENALRDEFNKKTEPFEKAYTAFDKMSRAVESNNSADAYAAVIDFVKTLDPGSTVREGEYMTAKSAGAGGSYGKIKQAIRNMYDGKMTPEVRKNLLEAGRNLMAAEQASYDRVRKDYKNRVENYNQRGVNLDTTAVLSTYPQIEGMDAPKSPYANDKTFNSFQEAARLPVGTGFWINGKHYVKGGN